MTLELTLAPSGAAVATPRHPLAPHFYPAPFQILPHRLQGHAHSTGICRRADADIRHLPQSLKGETHLVIKETGQSDQENLKDTGFEEADLVLKQMNVKTTYSQCKNIFTS